MANSTRQNLLDTAVDLLIDEGRSGITTGRLAAHAGVVQSAFYNHFASVDECVQAALDEIQNRVITTADVIFETLDGPGYATPGRVHDLLIAVYERAAANPSFFALLVRRHHERDIAEAIEALLDTMRAKTAASILHPEARTKTLSQAEAGIAARMVVAIFLAGLEEVLAGASPVVVSQSSAVFMTRGVFSVAGIEAIEPPDDSSKIRPAED